MKKFNTHNNNGRKRGRAGFPIYKDGDSDSKPTGGIRQLQYKLKQGEASRPLKLDKVVEL